MLVPFSFLPFMRELSRYFLNPIHHGVTRISAGITAAM